MKKLQAMFLSMKYLKQMKAKINIWAIKFVLLSNFDNKYNKKGISTLNGKRWFNLDR